MYIHEEIVVSIRRVGGWSLVPIRDSMLTTPETASSICVT